MTAAVAGAVLAALRSRGWTIATCESLTGGQLVAALIDVPGASAAVRGGLVTYAPELKSELAGVAADVIERCGVVSREVALAMAEGARARCGADVGVATTGVAGPEPVDDVPVGTVWVAVSLPGATHARNAVFPGDRAAVRAAAVALALSLVDEALAASAAE